MIAIALAAVCAIGAASAQDYPSRPVTIVVPLAPGGSTDTIGRIIAEGMRPHLGQPVIVENSPGAGGATGVIRVARSAPDGYTLQIGQWGTNVASGAVHDLPIDLLKDLEPVGADRDAAVMIVGRKDLPAEQLKELIAWLKANPEQGLGRNARDRQARAMSPACSSRTPSAPSSTSCRIAAPVNRTQDLVARQDRHDHGHRGDLRPDTSGTA